MASPIQTMEILDDETAAVLRRVSPGKHLAIMDRLWRFAQNMLRDVVARENPDWTEEEVQREVAHCISNPAMEEWAYKNMPRAKSFVEPNDLNEQLS